MKIRGVKKQYHGKTVVDSVSFEIQKGKVTALIAFQWSGKIYCDEHSFQTDRKG